MHVPWGEGGWALTYPVVGGDTGWVVTQWCLSTTLRQMPNAYLMQAIHLACG